MSKKRRAKKAANAAVVHEVLAEGSGPHAIPDEEGVVAVRVAPLEDSEIEASDPGAGDADVAASDADADAVAASDAVADTDAVAASEADAVAASDAVADADAVAASEADTASASDAVAPTPSRKAKRNKARRNSAVASGSADAESNADATSDAVSASGTETETAINTASDSDVDSAVVSVADSDADVAASSAETDADGLAVSDADGLVASDADSADRATAGGDGEGSDFDAVTSDGDHTEPVSAGAGDSLQAAAEGEQLDELDDGDGAVLPTSAATMDAKQLKSLVEALVFASDKPLTVPRLRQLTRVADVKRLEQALTELAADYEHRGLILHQVSGGYQFRTRPQYSVWVQQLIAGRPVRLSRAQLETLAIVAYRQPITRPEIDDIRGVDSSATLKLLLDRMLIRVLGKKEEVGRPTLYGTTKEFLDFFSLGDLRELPTLREYSELSEESRKVMSQRLGVDPDGGNSGGSTPPADGGPMDGGPMDGGPSDGASMSASPSDGDDASVAAAARLDTHNEHGADVGEPTSASLEGDGGGLDGDTPHSLEGDALDDDLGGATAHLDAGLDGETAHVDDGLGGETAHLEDGLGGETAHVHDGSGETAHVDDGLGGETAHSVDADALAGLDHADLAAEPPQAFADDDLGGATAHAADADDLAGPADPASEGEGFDDTTIGGATGDLVESIDDERGALEAAALEAFDADARELDDAFADESVEAVDTGLALGSGGITSEPAVSAIAAEIAAELAAEDEAGTSGDIEAAFVEHALSADADVDNSTAEPQE